LYVHLIRVIFHHQEEAGITAPLRRCGSLFFILEGSEAAWHIEMFVAHEYDGTITE
jgi:8-oxo-dGTP diphosphatase / 2-hydroxy-dATP diphosphatase